MRFGTIDVARWVTFAFACIGMFITTVLTGQKVLNLWLPCTGGSADCTTIQNSSTSSIAGMPISLLGFLAYATISILVWPGQFKLVKRRIGAALIISGIASFISIVLIFKATRQLNLFCSWCTSSAICFNIIFLALTVRWCSAGDFSAVRSHRFIPTIFISLTFLCASWSLLALKQKADKIVADRALIENASYEILVGHGSLRLGPANPNFTIIVFASTHCGGCRYIMPQVIRYAKTHPNMALVYRHRPLNAGEVSTEAAIEMLPDEDSKWRLLYHLYESDLTIEGFERTIQKAGLLPQTWRKRVRSRSDSAMVRVIDDAKTADKLSINGTPTIILIDAQKKRRVLSPPELLELLDKS